MISVEDALTTIGASRRDWGVEQIPIADAVGRILASPVSARVTQPPQAMSAMDGYAVRFADARTTGATLRVIGDAPAGAPFDGSVAPGEAVRIFTGGVVPEGADHIVIQEDTTRNGETVKIVAAAKAPAHIRAAGIDFSVGDVLIDQGVALGPADIAVAAAANFDTLVVRRRPSVAIISAGDELRAPGAALEPGQIIASNGVGLVALIQSWGADARDLGIATDDIDAIRTRIRAGREADILLPVGGASVGDLDLMRPALEAEGLSLKFSKVAVRPGKPTWFGDLDGQAVLGLPGNPASAWVCAHLFLRPLLGLAPPCEIGGRLAAPLAANGPRETYLRARARRLDGVVQVEALPNQDSSLLTPFLRANVLIRRRPNAPEADIDASVALLPLGRASFT